MAWKMSSSALVSPPRRAPVPQAVPTCVCFLGGERLPGEIVGVDEGSLRAALDSLAARGEDSDAEDRS